MFMLGRRELFRAIRAGGCEQVRPDRPQCQALEYVHDVGENMIEDIVEVWRIGDYCVKIAVWVGHTPSITPVDVNATFKLRNCFDTCDYSRQLAPQIGW